MGGYIYGVLGTVVDPGPPVPPQRVGAVYEPWMSRSKTTMQVTWIDPTGEGGIHRAYGGKHRDYQLNLAASGEPTAPQYNQDVADARAAGLDYFWADITNPRPTDGAGNYQRILKLVTATAAAQAANPGSFFLIPWLDINGGAFNGIPGQGTSSAMTPEAVADQVKTDFIDTGVCLMDGAYWIGSYKAEGDSTGKIAGIAAVTYWNRFFTRLAATVTAHPIIFQACLLHQTTTNFTALAGVPVVDDVMMSIWGPARPGTNVSNLATWANLAHSLGKDWQAPARIEDERPYSSTYAEAENTRLGREMWARTLTDNAKHVIVVTWNDFAEGTQILPSRNHGSAKSWFTKFYADWFRAGAMPTITADKIILSNRIHSTGQTPTLSGITTVTCTLDGGGTTPYNFTEALVFATAPATLFINGVSQGTVPAGITPVKVALALDQAQTASLVRSGSTVASVSSAVTPHNPPYVPDYDYRWAISA